MRVWFDLVDLLSLDVDAIVCGANTGLVMGSGTAGAIWRRGGQGIQDECDRLGTRRLGEVAVTSAGRLPARFVFHAVTMGYEHPQVSDLFRGVTVRCLELANERGLESLAFMALSGGRMKLSPEVICEAMIGAFAEWEASGSSLHTVGFALRDLTMLGVFAERLPRVVEGHAELELMEGHPPAGDSSFERPKLKGPRGRLP